MIKIILEHHFTARDVYGNVYHAARVVNARTGKGFVTRTSSKSNAIYDISRCFAGAGPTIHIADIPTGSARNSSLPAPTGGSVRGVGGWRKALRGVGFRFKRN